MFCILQNGKPFHTEAIFPYGAADFLRVNIFFKKAIDFYPNSDYNIKHLNSDKIAYYVIGGLTIAMVKSRQRCRVSPVIVKDNRALFIFGKEVWKCQEIS